MGCHLFYLPICTRPNLQKWYPLQNASCAVAPFLEPLFLSSCIYPLSQPSHFVESVPVQNALVRGHFVEAVILTLDRKLVIL